MKQNKNIPTVMGEPVEVGGEARWGIAHQGRDALPKSLRTEHLIKAVAMLTGGSETETRELLIVAWEENNGEGFAALVDFLAGSFAP